MGNKKKDMRYKKYRIFGISLILIFSLVFGLTVGVVDTKAVSINDLQNLLSQIQKQIESLTKQVQQLTQTGSQTTTGSTTTTGDTTQDSTTTTTTTATLTIVSPNGGEELVRGESTLITINLSGSDKANIDITLVNKTTGRTYPLVADYEISSGDNQYEWKIASNIAVGERYIISVTGDGVQGDESDNYFSIVAKSPCGSYGDLNGDGYVTGEDLTLLTNCVAGTTSCDSSVSDLNGDGKIDGKDVSYLSSYLAGLLVTFPVCGQVPVVTVVSPNGGESLLRGDKCSIKLNLADANSATVNVNLYNNQTKQLYSVVSSKILTPGLNVISWKVPVNVPVGTQYKVSVTGDGVQGDESDNYFSIVAKSPCGSYGDLNGDGYVTGEDLTLLTNCVAGTTSCDSSVSDLNGDGKIDGKDVSYLSSYLAGTGSTFPVCGSSYLTVFYPNGGEKIVRNSLTDIRIKWEGVSLSSTDTITVNVNLVNETIKKSYSIVSITLHPGLNVISWKVPVNVPVGTQYKVSVTGDGVQGDESDNYFSIVAKSPCGSYGDLNGDGYVTGEDLTLLTNCVAGTTSCDSSVSDLNGDGKIDGKDVAYLSSYLAGTTTVFPVCESVLPYIKVTYPEGDEYFVSGTSIDITWDSRGVNEVSILLYGEDGNLVRPIAIHIPASNHSYKWTTPQLQGKFKIRITGISTVTGTVSLVEDYSSSFSIGPAHIMMQKSNEIVSVKDLLASMSDIISRLAEQMKALLGK